jgi:single-strand DNA-binding protein
MRGLECAFWGTLGGDPELKTAKSGNAFAVMNVAVTVGKDDAGKDISQWVRVAVFGQTAEEIAARAAKSDRVYVEGSLTLNIWTTAAGEQRSGLNVAAWKVEKVPAIGKNRQFREKGHEPPLSSFKNATAHALAGAPFKTEPHRREKPRIPGLNDDFRDELPF